MLSKQMRVCRGMLAVFPVSDSLPGVFPPTKAIPIKCFVSHRPLFERLGRSIGQKKNVFFKWYFEKKWVGRAMGNETIYWDGLTTR